MRSKGIGLALVILSLSGCSNAVTPSVAAVQEADARSVQGCKFLGDVTGVSMSGAMAGSEQARSTARDYARRLGATHVVLSESPSGGMFTAYGKAYRCEETTLYQ